MSNQTISNITICSPLLLSATNTTTDAIKYGLCPDYVSSVILSAVVISLLLCFGFIGIILTILFRKTGYIKSRDPFYMIFSVCVHCLLTTVLLFRIITGRMQFSCGVYTLCFILIPGMLTMPTSFRSIRLFAMYRLNLLKSSNIQRESLPSNAELSISVSNSLLTQGNGELNSIPSVSSGIDKVIEEGQESNREYSKLEKSKLTKMKIYTFLASYKFMMITYFLLTFSLIILWIILGTAEELIHQANPNSMKIIIPDSGIFVFEHGCSMSTTFVFIIGAIFVIFISFETVSVILAFISDKDTWNIKRDTIILLIFQIISVISFVVTSNIEDIVILTDYFVPYGYSLVVYSITEVLAYTFGPALYGAIGYYALSKKNSTQVMESSSETKSEIELILLNRKYFEMALDFARRSFCVESISAWKDIQRYKELFKKKDSQNVIRNHARKMVENYLTMGSPFELNIPYIQQKKADYMKLIEENQSLDLNFFDKLENHCLLDMSDLFERLKSSNKEISKAMTELRNQL